MEISSEGQEYFLKFYTKHELKRFPFDANIKLQYTGENAHYPCVTVRDR